MPKSDLQYNPKSKVIEHGYINTYSNLSPQEKRQLFYKRKFKQLNPSWDDTLVYLSDKFKALVKQDSVVLDAGCGNGNYIIDENRSLISWAVGIDVDKEFTKKNVCLDEVFIGTLGNIPIPNNTVDAVVSLWVLEHLDSPEKVFAEIYRVLIPGGVFIFATPNKHFLPLVILDAVNSAKVNNSLNRKLFGRSSEDIFKTYYLANTVSQLNKLLLKNFEVIELRYNSDPSYLSFNSLTFKLSLFLNKMLSYVNSSLLEPHIIGIVRKNESTN